MSWMSDWMHPGRAYDEAGKEEEQGYNQGQGYRQPYMDRGNAAGGTLQEMLNKMKDPAALQDEWSKNYQTSEYAKQMQQEAQTGGMDAASAMGLGGSSASLANIQKGSADIMQKDRQNYMDNLMQKYMGAMGLGESMYNTGANAAENSANSAENHGQWQGQNKFNSRQAGANRFGQIGGSALSALMNYFTGGLTGGMGGI